MANEYFDTRRVVYEDEGATFVPVCKACGRFVKADETLSLVVDTDFMPWLIKPRTPNATCKKCGRTEMLFEGFIG